MPAAHGRRVRSPNWKTRLSEICRFLGISIRMFYADHALPRFHAVYGPHEIVVEISTARVIGTFPTRAKRLVLEWRRLREEELRADWERARRREPLVKIEPLE
ncbi:MAG: DUF4160 domain-containing protein [Candidatus Eisenbacteria bacterium]